MKWKCPYSHDPVMGTVCQICDGDGCCMMCTYNDECDLEKPVPGCFRWEEVER